MKYTKLFQPFQIGNIRLKNRLVMSPMTMNYATTEGIATEKLIHYYLERARGGVGLIIVEGTFFKAEGKGYRNQLGLSSKKHAEALRKLTDLVHGLNNEAKIFIQIHHAGGRASSKVTGLQPVAPSGLSAYPGAEVPRPLTQEEIRELVQAHVQASLRAKEAGFDGVDVHCAHGYLVPSFLSPLSNKRTDEYGGDLSGRSRFLIEIIQGIRKELGPAFPLTIKISGDEFIEGGMGLEEMKPIALLAEEAGIDAIMVSAGSVGAKKIGDLSQAHKVLRTLPMMTEPACLVDLAEAMKGMLRVPVITVGRIHHPDLAEEILVRSKADLVAMGRPLLADPYLPQKAMEAKEDEIRPCISCNEGCYKRIFEQLDIRCSVNPGLGREWEAPPGRTSQPKKLFVVGGGPAGLEAAYRAWERGHTVSLIEKERELGGQLNLASVPPGRKEIESFKTFLLKRLQNTGIKVITGKKTILPLIKKKRPDALIWATGATPRKMEISGLGKMKTLTAWEVLAGKKRPKGTCLILGAGLVGCETADYLSEKGNGVILVEVLPAIATGSDLDTKTYFGLRFEKKGVAVYTDTALTRFEGKNAILRQGEEEKKVLVDTLIFAVGADPNNHLDQVFQSSILPILKIGDCVKARSILEAVQEGFQAGRSI